MIRLLIIIALFLSTAALDHTLSRPEAKIDRRPLSELPTAIGDWKMKGEHQIDEGSMKVLLVDDYIMRNYANAKGEVIGLYVGYFEHQREGKGVHSPRQCLPGSGWSIVDSKVIELPENGRKGRSAINLFLMGKGNQRELFLWWYQGRGRVYANEYLNKLYLIWDAMTMRRTDGALVRINMLVQNDADETLQTETAFMELLSPLLDQFIPM